jgi:hypothetical protein
MQEFLQIILTTITIYSSGEVQQHSVEVYDLSTCFKMAVEFEQQTPSEESGEIGFGAGCVFRPERKS